MLNQIFNLVISLHLGTFFIFFHKVRFLVSGASGFIGGHLVRRLSEEGRKIRAFVRPTSNVEKLKSLKNVEIFYGDLTDFRSVQQAVEGCQVVYHVGGLVNDWGDYRKFFKVNYGGTKNMLEASVKASIQKFIYTSSIGVLDLSGQGVIKENQPYGRYLGGYCRSKAEAEKLVRRYSSQLQTIILRPAVVYGPEDSQCTLRSLNYAQKGFLFVIGGGQSVFPHLYIDNLVNALLLAAKRELASGEVFNLTDGQETTVREFFSCFNHIVGRDDVWVSLPYSLAWVAALLMDTCVHLAGRQPLLSWTALEFLTLKCRFDISKARQILDFKLAISLSQGMAKVERWWKSISYFQ